MSNLYVRFTDGNVESLKVGGSPMSIVNMARDCVAAYSGDATAARLFGAKRVNSAGNVSASVRERGMSAGLSGGEGFAVIAAGITVAGAVSLEQAIDCIGEAESMLAIARDMQSA